MNETGRDGNFTSNYNTVHIGESWHFMLKGGRKIKLLPNAGGAYTTPEAPSATSKRHIVKVMFIAALARPHPAYPPRKFGGVRAPGKF